MKAFRITVTIAGIAVGVTAILLGTLLAILLDGVLAAVPLLAAFAGIGVAARFWCRTEASPRPPKLCISDLAMSAGVDCYVTSRRGARAMTELKTIKKQILANTYVSQCKLCGCGVFSSQPWKWSQRPMGICHTSCLRGQS